jgi:integrase
MRRPPRGIPDADFGRILGRAVKWGEPFAALVRVARETGCRKGELLGLCWRDVLDGDGKARSAVTIRGQWSDTEGFKTTKTGNSRTSMFSPPARSAVEFLRGLAPKARPDERVFKVSEATAWRWFVEVQEALKIKNPETGHAYRFHDLRHSVGVELARAGRLDLAKRMLGHKRLETTMIYAELSPDEILEDVEEVRRKARKKRRGGRE